MYVSFNDIQGFTLFSGEEPLGSLADVYFDDRCFTVSYLVIETGGWFSSNQVLLHADQIDKFEPSMRAMHCSLKREDFEKAPPFGSRKPVCDQQQRQWLVAAGQGALLAGASGVTLPPMITEMEKDHTPEDEPTEEERHLRSAREVVGYNVQATDTDIGSISDLIIARGSRKIAYLSVDTGNWLPGKLVVVAPIWAKCISWEERRFKLNLSSEKIRNSPPLESLENLEQSYGNALSSYYGYPMV